MSFVASFITVLREWRMRLDGHQGGEWTLTREVPVVGKPSDSNPLLKPGEDRTEKLS